MAWVDLGQNATIAAALTAAGRRIAPIMAPGVGSQASDTLLHRSQSVVVGREG